MMAAEENKNKKFRYVRREGAAAGLPGLGLLNKSQDNQEKSAGIGKQLGVDLRGQIEGIGDRIENRAARIRQRLQNIGVGAMQQPEKELQKQVFFCPECKSEVTETQKFCNNCSVALTEEAKKEKEHKEKLRISSHMSVICDT